MVTALRELAGVKAKEMAITPHIAKEWLQKGAPNRRISESAVEKYAEDMREGRWESNGATIVMGRSGKILDGQHRLSAIVKANVTISMIVVSGVDDEAFKTIDTGRPRSVADVLRIMGYPNHLVLAATARQWLTYYETGEFGIGDFPLPAQRVIATAVQHVGEFTAAIQGSGPARKALKAPHGVWAVLWLVFGRIDPEDRDTFFEGLATGANLAPDSAVFALRRYFLEHQKTGARATIRGNLQAALIIKGWNRYRNHERTSLLVWRANEAFPEPI